MFKSRQFIIGIIISIIFLALAVLGVEWDQAWVALTQANYWALIPALVLYFIGVWVRAIRWRILLRPIVPRTTVRKTFEVVVIGYMANDIFPARIGELVRAYVLSIREGVRKTATLATIFVERIFDGITMLGFAVGAVLFILLTDPGALMTGADHKLGTFLTELQLPIAITAIVFLGALIVFLVVASSRTRTERLIALSLRFLPARFRERVERLTHSFIDGLGSLRSAGSVAAVLGLSIVAWSFETGMYYIIGNWGFDLRGIDGQPLPFYVYVMITGFVNLGTLIPQAPGFVGVFEFIAVAVLHGAFGVDRDQAISYVLVLHVALLVPVTLLGFYYTARESITYTQLVKLEETRAQASAQAHELEGPLTDIELVQEGKITEGDTSAETMLEQAGEEKAGAKPDTGQPAGSQS